jgi:hypothetical protein
MSKSPAFGTASEEREWAAQERALREERLGIECDGAEAHEYRLVVRALRDPLLDPIPDNFAARTAVAAERASIAEDRLEPWLQNGLLALLAAGGIWTMAEFGRQWLQALTLVMPVAARSITSWGVALLACIALSSALEHWRRRR